MIYKQYDQFLISDDKSLLDIDVIVGFLGRSYWADKRKRATIEASIRGSHCIGLYDSGRQIGFARVITDFATMYWLCDVFIDEAYRGRGLGKIFIETIIESDELRNLTGTLATKDAHSLYEQYGYVRDEGTCMRRRPDFLKNTE
ncbi:GNAT family N-acetyltransferase [Paenibacillus chartarius]|uniref:GNAT family N-acetyltransferase n=1 Tax=Paenibacillus chartarius TaxID=747481 RepID=A0ABV6DQU9_9BACL